jgi:hypothetical protein
VPQESQHHFLVQWETKRDEVNVSEHYEWDADDQRPVTLARIGAAEGNMRVIVSRERFESVSEVVAGDFNRRLRSQRLKAGRFAHGFTPLARALGKELVVLLWAIEDADPGQIPMAVANWIGLHPEERWWLYTQANAATGHAIMGRGRGWRKALRFALCENPADVPRPAQQMNLFGGEEDVWKPATKRARGRRKSTSGQSFFQDEKGDK